MRSIDLFTVLYGNSPLYELELFGSLYSAWKNRGNVNLQISIFTDRARPSLDNYPFKINQIQITDDEWREWTNAGKEKHLIKMHTMKKMLDLATGPVIFFDTDIIFKAPLQVLTDKIGQRNTLMQAPEGELGDYPVWKNFVESLPASDSPFADTVSLTSPMFNSGIVGMMPEHAPLMSEAIALAEDLYSRQSIFNIEQFATGKVLSDRTQLSTCEDDVLHYWGWRRNFIHIELERLRSAISATNWSDGAGLDVVETSPRINPVDKLQAFFWSLLHRDDPQKYLRFSYLSYLSSLRHSKDAQMANAWLDNSLTFMAMHVETNQKLVAGPNIYFLADFFSQPPAWLSAQNLEVLRNMLHSARKGSFSGTMGNP
ncbi:MAG: hypothetical protein QM709_00880 [Spongiibacteraceae bacterium]